MNPNKKTQSKNAEYFCESCKFKCSNKYDYNKHLLTLKHKKIDNPNKKKAGGKVFRRGGGKALRGMGKATYSNKMY